MFPACAGMNRIVTAFQHGSSVFPACAGMNRIAIFFFNVTHSVPRVRGDEPAAPARF